MAVNTRTQPSLIQFAVNRDPALGSSETNGDTIFEQINALGVVHGEIVNHSRTENLVLSLQVASASPWRDADYSTRQIRVNGSLVNSVTVAPLQSVTFTVDNASSNAGDYVARRFWRFRVTDQRRAFGTVALTVPQGELVLRKLYPTP